ncbi:MAG: hypothetical protein NZM37_11890 [Sandaracinaceae bacterium]|nr:hypothetical protein [Sandaracinaceae bacterium]
MSDPLRKIGSQLPPHLPAYPSIPTGGEGFQSALEIAQHKPISSSTPRGGGSEALRAMAQAIRAGQLGMGEVNEALVEEVLKKHCQRLTPQGRLLLESYMRELLQSDPVLIALKKRLLEASQRDPSSR